MKQLKVFRISSNATLFLKIVLPTFWGVFFGLLTLTILLADADNPFFRNLYVKLGAISLFLGFFLFLYFTVIRLKRLDVDEQSLYVSNYFKTFRYQITDISQIDEYNFFGINILKIKMKEKTSFGQSFQILINSTYWKDFVDSFPDSFNHLQ